MSKNYARHTAQQTDSSISCMIGIMHAWRIHMSTEIYKNFDVRIHNKKKSPLYDTREEVSPKRGSAVHELAQIL